MTEMGLFPGRRLWGNEPATAAIRGSSWAVSAADPKPVLYEICYECQLLAKAADGTLQSWQTATFPHLGH